MAGHRESSSIGKRGALEAVTKFVPITSDTSLGGIKSFLSRIMRVKLQMKNLWLIALLLSQS